MRGIPNPGFRSCLTPPRGYCLAAPPGRSFRLLATDYQLLPSRPSGALFPTPRYDYQLLSGRPSEPLLPDSSLRYRLPATVWPPLRAAPSRLLATLPTTSYCLAGASEPLLSDSSLPTTSYCLAAPPSRSFPTPRYRLPATVWPRLRAAPSDSSLRLPATVWPPLRAAPSRLLATDYQLLSGRPSEPLLPDSSLRCRLPATVWPPLRAAPSRLVAAE